MSKSMLPKHLQLILKSHSQKVCSLYKRALRNLLAIHDDRWEYRYHAVLMRHRFDENRNVKDLRKAKLLVAAGERELYRDWHYQQRKFSYSPGGINYGRTVAVPDWVMDYWHPLEKAQYPEYFAKREQRRQEFIERWEKKHGKPVESQDPPRLNVD